MMKLKEKLINFKRKDAQKSDINLLTVADLKKAKREKIKVWVFFGKIVGKKHLCRHDENHYYF